MADVPLNHLSRPQLVHLLLRIVDLLSLPSMPAQSAPSSGSLPCGPVVEPYDASIDPWNAPDESQGDPMATRDQGVPVGTGGCHSGHGPLNPAASAFYPVVSGPPACNPQSGCPGDPPGLPRFGVDLQGPLPCPVRVSTRGLPQSGLPTENALPGRGPWVRVCSFPCSVCGAPCLLQRTGHTNHLCEIHKIP